MSYYHVDSQSWYIAYYDSVQVVASALHQLLDAEGRNLSIQARSCKDNPAIPWEQGDLLYRSLKQVMASKV